MIGVFVDTGAWFARFVTTDSDHPAATAWLERNSEPLITTDYVIDELLTLLKIRKEYQRALEVGPELFRGEVCALVWVSPAVVAEAWQVFPPTGIRTGTSPIASAAWSWSGSASLPPFPSTSTSGNSAPSPSCHLTAKGPSKIKFHASW
jgi:PIN domain